MKVLGLTKNELNGLRIDKGLPYVRLNMRRRLYLEEDLVQWFKNRRVMADGQ